MNRATPGGDQQASGHAAFPAPRQCGARRCLQEAIDARPGTASTSPPPSGRVPRPACWCWKAASPRTPSPELKKRGHEVEVNDEWSEGRLTAATRDVLARRPPIRAACRATRRADERPSVARTPMSDALLELRGLTVDFATDDGVVHAVRRDRSGSGPRSRTLGLVGESGCSKSVTSPGLLPWKIQRRQPGRVRGARSADPRCASIRDLRGARLAMIFPSR